MMGYELVQAGAHQGIRCSRCGQTSWNPHDVRERYCGRCHVFHEDHPDCTCRNRVCGHPASRHTGPAGACVEPGCVCGPGGWT
jgi:hypothetical protein